MQEDQPTSKDLNPHLCNTGDGTNEETDKAFDENATDIDPLVDHALNHIIDVFYDMKQMFQMRGLMANSTPSGLMEVIKRSICLQEVNDDGSTTLDAPTDDELEPDLLFGY